jgi:hypothetical protein
MTSPEKVASRPVERTRGGKITLITTTEDFDAK